MVRTTKFFGGKDAALRRPDGAARRPYQGRRRILSFTRPNDGTQIQLSILWKEHYIFRHEAIACRGRLWTFHGPRLPGGIATAGTASATHDVAPGFSDSPEHTFRR